MAQLVKCLLYKIEEDLNSVSSTQIEAGLSECMFDPCTVEQGHKDPWDLVASCLTEPESSVFNERLSLTQ